MMIIFPVHNVHWYKINLLQDICNKTFVYIYLFGFTKQVYIRSSDYERTLMSAQTQLNGLYPPKGRQVNISATLFPLHLQFPLINLKEYGVFHCLFTPQGDDVMVCP